jgi:hypothetical protein
MKVADRVAEDRALLARFAPSPESPSDEAGFVGPNF